MGSSLNIYRCLSVPLFCLREYMLIDTCEAEEKVMEGLFAVGMNQHKELSTLTMLGEICLGRDQVCFEYFSFVKSIFL
jgi:exosome complex RNA-binding protein Rrp42 (RNase PH superfamily)